LAIKEGAAKPALRLGMTHNTPSQAKRKQTDWGPIERECPSGAALAASFNFGVVPRGEHVCESIK